MATKLSEEIDLLLEHYLGLLDQYDTLRSQLSIVQSSLHQHLARANFEADRGIRYGADLYDARMQASRLCRVTTVPETGTTLFTTSTVVSHEEILSPKEDKEGQGLREEKPFTTSTETEVTNGEDRERKEEETKTTIARPKDPIRMFGILIPSSLRIAQSKAVETIENLIPKLVSIDTELKDVEIRIRRARKHKAKAETMKTKQPQQSKGEDGDLEQVAEAAENAIEENAREHTQSHRQARKKSSSKNRLTALGISEGNMGTANATAMKDRESPESQHEPSNEELSTLDAGLETLAFIEVRARLEQLNIELAGMTNELLQLHAGLCIAIIRGPTTDYLTFISACHHVIGIQSVQLCESMITWVVTWRCRLWDLLLPTREDSLDRLIKFEAALDEVHALFQQAQAIIWTRNFSFYATPLLWGLVICLLVYAVLDHFGLY